MAFALHTPLFSFTPSLSPPSPLLASSSSSSSWTNSAHFHRLKLARSSSRDLNHLDEESKFVALNAEDPRFGPPALLLLGFDLDEIAKIQLLLKDLDGEFIQIVCCTEEMIPRSLWDAVTTNQPNIQQVQMAKSLPQICFLSGLSGEEMMMFIDAFSETGLKPPVFAALVPNSADKPVAELIEEIMGDHEMLTAK